MQAKGHGCGLGKNFRGCGKRGLRDTPLGCVILTGGNQITSNRSVGLFIFFMGSPLEKKTWVRGRQKNISKRGRTPRPDQKPELSGLKTLIRGEGERTMEHRIETVETKLSGISKVGEFAGGGDVKDRASLNPPISPSGQFQRRKNLGPHFESSFMGVVGKIGREPEVFFLGLMERTEREARLSCGVNRSCSWYQRKPGGWGLGSAKGDGNLKQQRRE